ncbi:D-Ala-D-Ala carboxypeptidase family metallohydrolase [Acinetobacter sp. WZC-1]|uniref:D-Ala-D-Ala carboxypeptidase family metallohydrolase n=1 Tax=Acinetobacter sp. WZC-1 TaxID=3459034 RepID=UPI00403E2C08
MKSIYSVSLLLLLSACSPSRQPIQKVVQPQPLVTQNSHTSHAHPPVSATYLNWLALPEHQQQVQQYKNFLGQYHLASVVPDDALFHSARDWQKCNAQEFEVPPQALWHNIVPTLSILKQLVDHRILTDFTVTSVYRNSYLNRCAGGADSSRHVLNAALDFRIGPEQPSIDEQAHIQLTKTRLCQFWAQYGEPLHMGLGVYASGQIHIDSLGYRSWGPDHLSTSSICLKRHDFPGHPT